MIGTFIAYANPVNDKEAEVPPIPSANHRRDEGSLADGTGLILLFGMPRSGTTWLGKILDSHPDTLYRHEPDSFGRLNFMPMAPDPGEAASWEVPLKTFAASLPDITDTKVAATLPQFPKRYLSRPAFLWNSAAIYLAKLQARLAGEARCRVITPKGNHTQVVWKSIESVARLGPIAQLLAQSRGVLLVRHPCGYVASVARGKRLGQFADVDSVGEDLELLRILADTPIGDEYGLDFPRLKAMEPIQRLTWQWILCNDKALAETESHKNIRTLTYEELAQAPLETAERLFTHFGLHLAEQSKRFIQASTSQHGNRYYGIYKDPAKAAFGWEKELPTELQAKIKAIAAGTRAGALFGL